MTGWLGRIVALMLLLGLAACGPSKFKSYSGPPVTQVVVNKGARQMLLLNGNRVLKAYRIGLGNAPLGHKQFEGDGRTPEGLYYIDRRNPDSSYHLSIGISYPNPQDAAQAASIGRSAGSDIFIHGQGPEGRALSRRQQDWTAGCIAVTDEEAEDIYAMVRDGTPILITP
ncbi:L,D-transpeptidase catalytic domain [Paracoccus thiocyanatus]|uniref:L,D-transpeptidase catalytic domain n=1 Tax=Paracoccus thiocyanatus TaxID=34006 RepID=A0A1N6NCV1_9RHOB|nr:L,D-transpeptidase family protein [Paracoccus thiocyanatus]SIP89852.1 L,D-transpeptidase catalytic domain [Paracoccus thiocyanatus]